MTKERYNEIRKLKPEEFLFAYYSETVKDPIIKDLKTFLNNMIFWVNSLGFIDPNEGLNNILHFLDVKFAYVRIIK